MDSPTLLDVQRCCRNVQRFTQSVEHVSLGDVANGNHDGVARVAHLGSTHQTVGRLHRNRAHHVVTNVQGDLKSQQASFTADLHVELKRVVQRWHRLERELDVNDGTGNACDAADSKCCGSVFRGGSHVASHSLPAVASDKASAPPTISLISWVISA